ncbi:hypothetical protein [Akkermansia sp.]|uniref:hypothetical protein n=1 Tax=Akkermansia sp. TaxID=1872421 RepID=UPI0025BD5123|nr:hypothetical protein [Akkermansia sp.]MCC8149591.1 hypothetical protein [Akkermansia sp.]
MNKKSIFIAGASVLLLGLTAWFVWPWFKGRERNATAPLTKQQLEIREITSTGYGYGKEDAIRQALDLAKAQMYGDRISKKDILLNVKHPGGGHLRLEVAADQHAPDIISFEVLSEKQTEEKEWEVSVRAKMYAPHKDMFKDKISLVMSSAEELGEKIRQFGFPQQIVSSLSQSIVTPFHEAFGASQEFVLLERGNQTMSAERDMLKHDEIASAEKIKSKQLKAADFVFDIQPEGGDFQINSRTSSFTGQTVYSGQWSLNIRLKMIELASNAILAATTVSVSGKGNGFREDACMNAFVKDMEKKVSRSIRTEGGKLIFRLGYPQLKHGRLLKQDGDSYVYQFMLKGPHLLNNGAFVSLYTKTSAGQKTALEKSVIHSYDVNSKQIIIKTNRKLNLDSDPCFGILTMENSNF